MKLIIQRVTSASVKVERKKISSISQGYLILLGIEQNDVSKDLNYLVNKTINLRIFKDSSNKMNASIKDIGGMVLVVSQFTLCSNVKKGNRPSFKNAGKPNFAFSMYQQYCEQLELNNIQVEKGAFGADMQVSLVNDGPVTIILDSNEKS
tara:strand:- start:817 stop:1266 length:450 start_codon:yes stop_codon:yes gene_type:complete